MLERLARNFHNKVRNTCVFCLREVSPKIRRFGRGIGAFFFLRAIIGDNGAHDRDRGCARARGDIVRACMDVEYAFEHVGSCRFTFGAGNAYGGKTQIGASPGKGGGERHRKTNIAHNDGRYILRYVAQTCAHLFGADVADGSARAGIEQILRLKRASLADKNMVLL